MRISHIYRQTPELFYTPLVYRQIEALIELCMSAKRRSEVGWMGMVSDLGDMKFMVEEIFVPEQICDATNTEISKEAITALGLSILDQDRDTSDLYYWGHVHPNMGVSPSPTDEDQLMEYGEEMECPFFIRGIYNDKGATRVDMYDFANNFAYEECPNGLYVPPLTTLQRESLEAVFKKNVKYPKPVVTPLPTNNRYGHQYGGRSIMDADFDDKGEVIDKSLVGKEFDYTDESMDYLAWFNANRDLINEGEM